MYLQKLDHLCHAETLDVNNVSVWKGPKYGDNCQDAGRQRIYDRMASSQTTSKLANSIGAAEHGECWSIFGNDMYTESASGDFNLCEPEEPLELWLQSHAKSYELNYDHLIPEP